VPLVDLMSELFIHRTLNNHPNIVKLVGAYFKTASGGKPSSMIHMLELGWMTLKDFVSHYVFIHDCDVASWARSMCTGLGHIHGCSILHRDMKPANCILFYRPGECICLKIGDFGASAVIAKDPQSVSTAIELGPAAVAKPLTPLRTTYQYASPEVLRQEPYSFPLDVWSAGVILYEMLQEDPRVLALTCDSSAVADFVVAMGKFLNIVEEHKTNTKFKAGHALHMVCRMLAVVPCDRPAAGDLSQDPWLLGQPPAQGLEPTRQSNTGGSSPPKKRDESEEPPASGLVHGPQKNQDTERKQPPASGFNMFEALADMAPILQKMLHPWASWSGDITSYIRGCQALGKHKGNVLLHYILALAKYPIVVEMLSARFSQLPKRFKGVHLQKV